MKKKLKSLLLRSVKTRTTKHKEGHKYLQGANRIRSRKYGSNGCNKGTDKIKTGTKIIKIKIKQKSY